LGKDKLPDQYITEGYLYWFSISKSYVYDVSDHNALVVTATTVTKQDLPSWIHFNPMSYIMSGRGPSPQEQVVMMNFQHRET